MVTLNAVRWSLFAGLVVFGGWAVIINWAIALRWILFRQRGSCIPVLGGACVAAAFAAIPWDVLNGLCWTPLLADIGCVPMLLALSVFLLSRAGGGR
jgi:hypothetical protein